MVNHILTILSNMINQQKLTDAHTCYKVCSREVLIKLNFMKVILLLSRIYM